MEENVTSKGLMTSLASLNLEQMKAFTLVTLPEVKDISVTIKDLVVESIDVVVDEAGNNPKQVKSEDFEDDEDYPST